VHLYNQNTAQFEFGGQAVQLEQQTSYPWDGRVQLTVKSTRPVSFELALRVPGWCRSYTLAVNDQQPSVVPDNGYVVLDRQWQNGDCVTLVLDMPVERMAPHPDIRHNAGQMALQRGPVVYCLEEVDNGAKLANVIIPQNGPLRQILTPICSVVPVSLPAPQSALNRHRGLEKCTGHSLSWSTHDRRSNLKLFRTICGRIDSRAKCASGFAKPETARQIAR
jgi:DUF1680 family protein